MSWVSGARARLHLLFGWRAAESRMNEEIGFHIDMETERLIREERLPPDEARRRALVAFSGVTQCKEEIREGRGLAWLGGFSLDMKLGFRMLMKYPGLTLVGGLAMAFGIATGAVTFEMATMFLHPSLPLPGGDRIVQLRLYDVVEQEEEPKSLHDFLIWKRSLSSVTDLGAYRDVTRNLVVGEGARPVDVAEITASAFRVASARPLLGRMLTVEDERSGNPVVVIGHDVWRTRFASDSNVIGRSVRLGDAYATVVGVMPELFRFPIAHEAWMPLRADTLDQAPRQGAAITIFGRLAPSASLQAAQTELTTRGRRMATELRSTHEHLTPQIASYVTQFNPPEWEEMTILTSIYLFAVMLLVLICGNVGLLLFARAAARQRELVVRSALGATRARIVMQLFAEALVLGAVAAVVGLAAAHMALETWGTGFVETIFDKVPFWLDARLSPTTIVYALALTMLAAVVAGVLPALKITRGLGTQLKEGTAGSGVRFGGVWTAVIIAQVAVTVAFPIMIFMGQFELRRIQSYDVGFAADEYLGVELELDEELASGEGATADSTRQAQWMRFAASVEGLRQRVSAAPGVLGVTFVDRLPRMYHRVPDVQVDDVAAGDDRSSDSTRNALHEVSLASIDPSYFEVLKVPMLAGRPFQASDVNPEARVVIVDKAFVDQVLRGRNAIGRRLRYSQGTAPDGTPAFSPWIEIIGVVKELGMTQAADAERMSGVYMPSPLWPPVHMMVHVRGDPMSVGPRVRELAAMDPALRLTTMLRVDQVADPQVWLLGLWLRISVTLTAAALLLSLAGIYAVLSFTVARRTREIGVRVALGASRRRLVADIFRRPLTQVVIGVAVGGALIAAFGILLNVAEGDANQFDVPITITNIAALLGYASLMFGICLLACVVPTMRALRVQPTEALRAE